MQAFRRVVELHSFGAAARSMGITGGVVSKLVAQLGRDLGVRLLHRTTRSVSVSAERVLRAADAACYAAKRLGRNRVEIHRAPPALAVATEP